MKSFENNEILCFFSREECSMCNLVNVKITTYKVLKKNHTLCTCIISETSCLFSNI